MGDDPGFGVYIHWPFCQAKCPYCDFNSHVSAQVDYAAWEKALVQDIRRQADLSDAKTVTSIFFGGGTPSLMPPRLVGACIDEVAARFDVGQACEISLEANPTSVEASRFAGFRTAGVERLSLGVQSLKDDDLKRLGRLHSAQEAIEAFDIARENFDRVSFDLIYARQDQSLSDWQNELGRALELAIDHLSLYQLTIEPGTRFGALYDKGNLKGLPLDDLAADMFLATYDQCGEAGFEFYEISNAARNGAVCQHNMTYWRYGPYIGVGPGAHGRRLEDGRRFATESIALPGEWLDAALGRSAVETVRLLNDTEALEEALMMGLRLEEGVPFGPAAGARDVVNPEALEALRVQGLVDASNGRLKTTGDGRLVLNAVVSELLN